MTDTYKSNISDQQVMEMAIIMLEAIHLFNDEQPDLLRVRKWKADAAKLLNDIISLTAEELMEEYKISERIKGKETIFYDW